MMDFTLLKQYTKRPEPYAAGTAIMWDDPHISKHMLEAHLNPEWDAASRKPATIERTIEWMNTNFFKPGSRILDLGCGPGLYASRLHRLGHEVVGIDFSRRSIDYAQKTAQEQGQNIEYIYQNYLTLDYTEMFDAIILIYCDLGVFGDTERNLLLQKIHRTLKPGGVFIFDLFNEDFVKVKKTGQSWYTTENGFWAAESHLVLEETFHYPEVQSFLDQYVVYTASGRLDVYRCWDRYYSNADVEQMLHNNGFHGERFFTDILPVEPGQPASVTFTVTHK